MKSYCLEREADRSIVGVWNDVQRVAYDVVDFDVFWELLFVVHI